MWVYMFFAMGAGGAMGMLIPVAMGLPEWIAAAVVGVYGAWLSAVFGPDLKGDWQQAFVGVSGLALAAFYWTWVLGN